MDDRSNIVLTGFMGTGKSTVGRIIADRTDRTLVDTDIVIEDRFGPIHEIFERQGEAAFRQMERDLAHELGAVDGLVIATGGRMMLDASNIGALRDGRVFTLTADAVEIHRRIAGDGGPRRPLLEVADPLERIRSMLRERADGYSLFTQIQSGRRKPSSVAGEIVGLVDRGPITLEHDARIVIGVSELSRWRHHVRDDGSHFTAFGSAAADRLAPLLGDVATRRAGSAVVVGGLPPETFGLYVPTDLPTLLWWVSHPEAEGDALVDVGLLADDPGGLEMLDQYLRDFVRDEVPSWSRRAGAQPGLLDWLLDAIEAVCRLHGFEPT